MIKPKNAYYRFMIKTEYHQDIIRVLKSISSDIVTISKTRDGRFFYILARIDPRDLVFIQLSVEIHQITTIHKEMSLEKQLDFLLNC